MDTKNETIANPSTKQIRSNVFLSKTTFLERRFLKKKKAVAPSVQQRESFRRSSVHEISRAGPRNHAHSVIRAYRTKADQSDQTTHLVMSESSPADTVMRPPSSQRTCSSWVLAEANARWLHAFLISHDLRGQQKENQKDKRTRSRSAQPRMGVSEKEI